jgi:hypothetical protein
VSFQCVLRWVLSGSKTPDGSLIKLEAVRLGGHWLTSREALQRFAESLTLKCESTSTPVRTPRQRQRAVERAKKQLEQLGV